MNRKNGIFIIILFYLAFACPLILSDKKGGAVFESENRRLAEFPRIFSDGLRLNPGVRDGLSAWINDNAGGRNLAVKANYLLSYNLFHSIPDDMIIVGKDNWLYSVFDTDWPTYLNRTSPTEDEIKKDRSYLTRITRDLNRDGIQCTFMLWPYKHDIYPENIPGYQNINQQKLAIQVMDDRLSDQPGFDFETAYELLYNAKSVRQDYYKAYDKYHWNRYGSFLGYQMLMEQAKRHVPNLRVLQESDFTIRPIIRTTRMDGGFDTREEDLEYSLIGGYHAAADPAFFTTFPFKSSDPWHSYAYYKNADSSLPRAVIVGDSFIYMWLLPDFAESFSQLVFIHYYDLVNLNAIIAREQPDIVIMAGLGTESFSYFKKFHYERINP